MSAPERKSFSTISKDEEAGVSVCVCVCVCACMLYAYLNVMHAYIDTFYICVCIYVCEPGPRVASCLVLFRQRRGITSIGVSWVCINREDEEEDEEGKAR